MQDSNTKRLSEYPTNLNPQAEDLIPTIVKQPTGVYRNQNIPFSTLKGGKGDKGDTGNVGPIGPVGPQGIQGIKGDKGDKGEQGVQGPIGLTGSASTVPGPKGDTGNQGLQGVQGPQGLKGDKGNTGDTGSQGPIGLTGAKGDKGDTGEQGPIGLTGPKGDQGIQGPKGDTGQTGETQDISGKLDKQAGTSSVYAQLLSGSPGLVSYSSLSNAATNTLVQRSSQGQILLGAPTENNNAATKTYVDTAVAGRAPTGTTVTTNSEQTISALKIFSKDKIAAYFGPSSPTYSSGDSNRAPSFISTVAMNQRSMIDTLGALSGSKDYLYLAHLNPEYTITATGAPGAFSGQNNLFGGSLSNNLRVRVADLATTPFVLTVTKNSGNILSSDVGWFFMTGHRLYGNSAVLTDYDIEFLSGQDNQWYTEISRRGVSDDVNYMTHSLHTNNRDYGPGTSTTYHSIRGFRLTIYGGVGASFEPAWMNINSIQLRDTRPSATPSAGVGALDLAGGNMYGDTTWQAGGVVIKSPNGTRYRLTVTNDGTLTTAAA